MVQAAKQTIPESISVTLVMVTTKAQRILNFNRDFGFVIQGCLSAKGTIEAFHNRSFFFIVTHFSTGQPRAEQHKIIERLIKVISTVISTGWQKTTKDEQYHSNTIYSVCTDGNTSALKPKS